MSWIIYIIYKSVVCSILMGQLLKKTKILATLGPASSDPDVIEDLLREGVTAFRLNFSHGSHEDHRKNIETIRAFEEELQQPIPIIQDLQGPKIRVGTLSQSIQLASNDEITLQFGQEQEGNTIPVQEDIFPFLKPGDPVFINDGIIRLTVRSTSAHAAVCDVIEGGVITTHKGINIPDTNLPTMALTDKDKEDLAFGLEHGVDYVAVSFVQNVEDILTVQKLIKGAHKKTGVIAKIETKAAIEHLEDIIHHSNAVMVARGDLAVELGQEEVPIRQREIIALARKHNTPVIIATQMLESMITNPEPTRAEVNDVATAVLDQVDVVMLSGESAVGKHPIRVVSIMDKIIRRTETYLEKTKRDYEIPELVHGDDFTSAIDAAAGLIVHSLQAKMIFALTASGTTVYRLATYRPKADIIGISNSMTICRQLKLVWGTDAFYLEETDIDAPAYHSFVKDLLHRHNIDTNDTILFISGKHPGKPGFTNSIHIATAKEYEEV